MKWPKVAYPWLLFPEFPMIAESLPPLPRFDDPDRIAVDWNHLYIAIADIDELPMIRFLGRSLALAAYNLEPGTCFGLGKTKDAAIDRAKAAARKFARLQKANPS